MRVTFYGDAIVFLGFYQSFPGLDHRVPRDSMPLLLYSSRDITSKRSFKGHLSSQMGSVMNSGENRGMKEKVLEWELEKIEGTFFTHIG